MTTRRRALAALAGMPLALDGQVPVQVPAPRGEDITAEAKALRKARWTPERAFAYMARFGAIKACNYVPADASSVWAESSKRIVDLELGWAHDVGLNGVRVFLQLSLHQERGERLFDDVDRFLGLAAKHGHSVMPVLQPSSIVNPNYKPQPGEAEEPETESFRPGVHGSYRRGRRRRNVMSTRQNFAAAKAPAKAFVEAMLKRYGRDERIVSWDLFNEPIPPDRAMVEHMFACAREAGASQPLTATWQGEDLSDVYSFHTYGQPGNAKGGEPELLPFDVELKQAVDSGRPLVCTECLARSFGNTFEAFLPYFAKHKVGWYIWGLCAGSAQHHYPWRWPIGSPEPKNWFHCILYPDGTPYRDHEIELIRTFKFES